MLVGDVRCARTGFGSSWKLSGGRKWSSGPTNASKNRHVRRAVERRRVTSSGARGDVARARGGRLIHRATSGERPQSRTNGAAMAQLPGLAKTTRAAAAAASRTAPAHALEEAGHVQGQRRADLGGRGPLQQLPSRVQPAEGSRDRVAHQPSLMGEEGDAQRDLGGGNRDVPGERTKVAALGDPPSLRHDLREDGNQGGHRDGDENEARPQEGRTVGKGPAGDERQPGGWRRQRPAQIVQHLPTAYGRDPGATAPGGATTKDPGKQLPVSAGPPVLARGRVAVLGRELLEELEIGDESRPRKDAFEEVMAEQRVLGDPAGQRGGEGVDVIDALAGVGALAEQILVDVGDCARVRIDAGRAGEQPLKQRSFAIRWHGRGDARLQDRVAIHDPARPSVEHRPIERMRQEADETGGGSPREARSASRVITYRTDAGTVGGRPRSARTSCRSRPGEGG